MQTDISMPSTDQVDPASDTGRDLLGQPLTWDRPRHRTMMSRGGAEHSRGTFPNTRGQRGSAGERGGLAVCTRVVSPPENPGLAGHNHFVLLPLVMESRKS